ncbi:hypothetical protein GDI3469 [Gluconacetobacter diazotrophicus PA1 5]|uniref:Uncharacterized protein n=1 Tax=Gluconacetobacter diazotrophicus (strain ATCC 49037 / DSM 5601 / CCUG 37298 / CIP 103539 / LMG 7603 / PAl5) TaxID=272568 RepID=A9H4A3_GLUDA|nr:hypothetical protein GDI3469 [Gluconacetobacter diazotrophicus PA1 5]
MVLVRRHGHHGFRAGNGAIPPMEGPLVEGPRAARSNRKVPGWETGQITRAKLTAAASFRT